TVLDIDAEQIDLIRRIGFKVFYGDATRLDLLRSAGAANAKILIIAIDDPEKSVQLVETVQKEFPNLTLLVRAKDREHAYKLINLGVKHIFRETLDTSLDLTVQALRLLGFGAYRAHRAARIFKGYDEESVRHLAGFVNLDEKDFLGEIRRRVRFLDDLFEAERSGQPFSVDAGWDRPHDRKPASE
ncbi:MAG: NAD-binding protein, partial [Verrucomicrobia bacterium]|nr:NAD-binding protein [Verrucomicrobiota bacterium]